MKLDIKHYPLLLKIVCIIVLLPILAAPLVFYTSVFIFDHPSNILLAYAMFFGVNSYSLVLLGICWASVAIYTKTKKKLYSITPFILLAGLIYGAYWYAMDGPIDKQNVWGNDYRLYRDTPCEDLAKAIRNQDVKRIDEILTANPKLAEYKDPKCQQQVLFYAIKDGKYKSAEALLRKGAEPNAVFIDSVSVSPARASTPLNCICGKCIDEEEKLKWVKLLVQYGADVNAYCLDSISEGRYIGRWTPLSSGELYTESQTEVLRFLLNKGADPNRIISRSDKPEAIGNDGQVYPIETAVLFNDFAGAEELLRHGADPSTIRQKLIDAINGRTRIKYTDKELDNRRHLLKLIEKMDSARH